MTKTGKSSSKDNGKMESQDLVNYIDLIIQIVHNYIQWNQCLSQELGIFQNSSYQFFFYSSQKKIPVICGGGFCGEIFLSHANQKFNTCLLTCRQTRKIYEYSHRPVCQYIAPCMIIALNVIAIDKYTYNMLFIFCYNPLEVHE